MKINKNRILIFLFLLPLWMSAQKWTAPEETKEIVAPFLFTDESIKAGEVIYAKNCKSCHGPVGLNTPAPISPVPADPASDQFQSQNDGEMFWKITHGKTPMPQFQSVLTEEERWQVIAYMRNFNPKYIQPAPTAKGTFKGVMLNLGMKWDSINKKISVVAMQAGTDNQLVPFKGAPIQLSVQRMFGKMNFGDLKKTDATGVALFDFPDDMPGDKEGFVVINASVNEEGIMAKTAISRMKIGKPVLSPGLYVKHQMWSQRGEGPLWLSFLYGSIILTIWSFIIYVIYQTFKISKLGRKNKDIIEIKS